MAIVLIQFSGEKNLITFSIDVIEHKTKAEHIYKWLYLAVFRNLLCKAITKLRTHLSY